MNSTRTSPYPRGWRTCAICRGVHPQPPRPYLTACSQAELNRALMAPAGELLSLYEQQAQETHRILKQVFFDPQEPSRHD